MFSARKVNPAQTGAFTPIVLDYLSGAEELQEFFSHPPDTEGITRALQARTAYPTNRPLLVKGLREQYAGLPDQPPVQEAITALADASTFTVCTAHQPNLLTGPLYFIYKILHAVRLASDLQAQFPGHRFVPVYYMGSEDADKEELLHCTVEGRRLAWATTQEGAVGRMELDSKVEALLAELEGQLGVHPYGGEVIKLLKGCYSKGKTLRQATLECVHALFGRFGLVVVDGDRGAWKEIMTSVFREDLWEGKAGALVGATSARLEGRYGAQAHPRDINLFYLEKGLRARIEREGSGFAVVGTDIRFTESEMEEALQNHPECFSPNVILRGLYQERLLPNLAFIGGGGELAYWLQLKDLFRHYNTPFPVLVLRNSFMLVPGALADLSGKLALQPPDLFLSQRDLLNQLLERRGLQPKLNGVLEQVREGYRSAADKAGAVDPTLARHAGALMQGALNRLQVLEKKMQRAERKKQDALARQAARLREGLFPGGGLQERTQNFSSWYARLGPAFLDELLYHSNALQSSFTVLSEEVGGGASDEA